MNMLKNLIIHLIAIKDGIIGLFDKKYLNPPFNRIVFICGISANKYSLIKWDKMLNKIFPNTEIVIMRKYYLYTQKENVNFFVKDIIKKLSEDKKTLLIGYSFGGMLAKMCINSMKSTDHIMCLVTLGTPHSMKNFGIKEAIRNFSIPESVNIHTITIGGNLDAIVPLEYTKMKGSSVHYVLPCTHLAFVHIRRTRKEVIDIIMHNCINNV